MIFLAETKANNFLRGVRQMFEHGSQPFFKLRHHARCLLVSILLVLSACEAKREADDPVSAAAPEPEQQEVQVQSEPLEPLLLDQTEDPLDLSAYQDEIDQIGAGEQFPLGDQGMLNKSGAEGKNNRLSVKGRPTFAADGEGRLDVSGGEVTVKFDLE